MNEYIEKVCDVNKIWAYMICSIYSFMEPVSTLLFWLFIFVFTDLITGIICSLKNGKYMTSEGLRKTVIKLTCYLLAITLTNAISVYMLDWLDFTKFMAALLCGIELYSIFENFYKITGHRSFKILTQFTIKTIEEKTGVNISEENN